MRSRASWRVLLLSAVVLLACGCSSPTKRDYLHHLSVTVAPNESTEAVTPEPETEVVAVEGPPPRGTSN